jgi:hypothetical protein
LFRKRFSGARLWLPLSDKGDALYGGACPKVKRRAGFREPGDLGPGSGRWTANEHPCQGIAQGQERWCRRPDLNRHELGSLPPQDSVSTNSTTSALISKSSNLLHSSTRWPCGQLAWSLTDILSYATLVHPARRLPMPPLRH